MNSPRPQAMPMAWLMPVSIGITLGLALLHLPFPFHGDQAFTLSGAQAIAGGATLFVDFWDIRQPGAIWFFWAAGRLFGFSEIGVHVLEVLWMFALAGLVVAVARRLVTHRPVVWLAPILTVGVYYAHASAWELTQPEALVMLPLGACLLVALYDGPAVRPRAVAGRWALFGAAAAATAVFKLLLLIIPIALAGTACWYLISNRRTTAGEAFQLRLVPALGGAVCIIAPVIAHFWSRGALDEVYWATFVASGRSLAEIPRGPFERLATSAFWFAAMWLPVAPLVWLGVQARRQRREVYLLLAWIAAATVVILIQRFHYWPYHFLLMIVPVGLAALCGLDAALVRFGWARPADAVGLSLLLVPVLLTTTVPVVPKIVALYEAAGRSHGAGDAFRSRMSPSYTPSRQAAAAISVASARPGAIFVFGNPQILVYSGRTQAIPLRGWASYALLDEQWAMFPSLLARARPAYIYVSETNKAIIGRRSPATAALIAASYRPFWKDDEGQWHELTDPPRQQ